ncbi:hypothetical protein DBB42_11850 [Pseudomonas plecoglossicida]|uniref:Uncharacterized protein n=1 Tax=Pseudomonas plecoglossicida TaxID=70775 RepID=A0A2R7UJB5_PSEDL|nr:hypothetical protein DBB42_11850 [Pseudomonas plecoglossicida]RFP99404.1 hypothetical protein D0O09_22725 [Pseudomonas putida]
MPPSAGRSLFDGRGGAPVRGRTRPHRYCTGFESCAVPVGAGLPAIGLQSSPSISDACAAPASAAHPAAFHT